MGKPRPLARTALGALQVHCDDACSAAASEASAAYEERFDKWMELMAFEMRDIKARLRTEQQARQALEVKRVALSACPSGGGKGRGNQRHPELAGGL
jgi:hypothetical protein